MFGLLCGHISIILCAVCVLDDGQSVQILIIPIEQGVTKHPDGTLKLASVTNLPKKKKKKKMVSFMWYSKKACSVTCLELNFSRPLQVQVFKSLVGMRET